MSSLPLVSLEKHLFERSKRNVLTLGAASRYTSVIYPRQTSHGTVENGERRIREYRTLISIVLNGDYLKRNAAHSRL